MFQEDYQYFPSLREIRDELVKAQINELEIESQKWTNKMQFKSLKSIYQSKWKMLFEIVKLGNLDQPLTAKILSDPNNKITKHILYLYSMETFIYGDLNRASREKDKTKIQYYGAFAAVLSYIIYSANKNRKSKEKLKGVNTLYRGLKMT